MYDAILPSDAEPPVWQRMEGEARITFREREGASRLGALYQKGSAKLRLPRVPPGSAPEAVLINTAGGVTGGDILKLEGRVEAGARAVLTTQASEKVYRASAGVARVSTSLCIAEGARCDWLPQETILFDGGRLHRSLEVEMAEDASFVGVEAVVFGRTSSGESVRSGALRDFWKVRREGRLIFADCMRIDGEIAEKLERRAAFNGNRAAATLVAVSSGVEAKVESLRAVFRDNQEIEAGVSAWDGLLVSRILGSSGWALRRGLLVALTVLRGGVALPKVWHC